MRECLERMACKAGMMRGQMILKLRLVFTWLSYAANANTHTRTHTRTLTHTHAQSSFHFHTKRCWGAGGGGCWLVCAPAASRFITLNSRPERPQKVCNMGVQLCLCSGICVCVTIGGRSCVFRCVGVPESVVRLLTCCAAFHICVYNLLCFSLPLPLPLHVCVGVPVHVSMLVYVWVCVCICGCFVSFQGFMLLKTLQVRM